MIAKFKIPRRHFVKFVLPGIASLSTTIILGSCGTSNKNSTSSTAPTSSVTNTNTVIINTTGIKTKVLRMGYQQAGDLVRVTGVLEKRLEPLGIKVEWAQFAQGPQLMEAMNVGKIDIGSVGETPPIFAQAAGAQIVYLAGQKTTLETGRGSVIAVTPESPIQTVADIKGQKVVFQKASASHYFILRALEDVGLQYSDIKVLSMPTVESRGAFIEGNIPVWVTSDPHLALAEKLGRVRILRDARGIDSPGGYYVGSRQFALENSELVRIVIEEIDKIEQWAEANPQETAKLIAPEQKLELDVMQKVIDRRTFGRRAISSELIAQQQKVADYFYRNGLLPKPLNVQEAMLTTEQYAAITPATISQK